MGGVMSEGGRRVLVVEDEDEIRERIVRILDYEGYDARGASSVREGLRVSQEFQPELVISDILMPNANGLDLVSVLRSRSETRLTPVIMVTALSEREWQRCFMELGADDYISKPFSADELLNAVKAQCRKLDWREAEQAVNTARRAGYVFEGRVFDPVQRTVTLEDGTRETLTVSESQLLLALVEHAGETQSRETIFEAMGRHYSPFDRTVDVLIGRLRRKIGDDTRDARIVVTVRSSGYVLAAEARRVALD